VIGSNCLAIAVAASPIDSSQSMTLEISAMSGLESRLGSVSQKRACRAFLKQVVRYSSKYPFA
jgi:hypothetical protein